MQCPCCGSKIEPPALPVDGLNHIRLTPKQRKIMSVLVKSSPTPAKTEVLIDALYAHDPNGGPLTVRNVIAVQVKWIRRALKPYGWTIPSCKTGSGAWGAYRLEKISLSAKETRP